MLHTLHRSCGLPAAVEAARQALSSEPRVTGTLRPIDEPMRILDGASALTVAATDALALPQGLADDKSQPISALHDRF